ncbi:hypothetical protein PTQ19_07075 [Microbacterium esteraromaticum]|uniref:hypothetical protein n=1 Tax=Microbacterium esteraromaticum TaxID=57043 RepID=UPI0023685FCD|nr:hypothetical protein [Microbacterium esteraromaticum]WDH80185.1 hypothetical protein PTQ19_07075 [Microbacterium esteraromaticum]
MSDRVCIRGCKQRGVHYATCAWFGIEDGLVSTVEALPNAPEKCTGCAERPARDQVLICDGCYGRLRGLLYDAPDLIGRLRSLADPMRATPLDQQPSGRGGAVEPPAPVDAELLDALDDLVTTWGAWQAFTHPDTLAGAVDRLLNDHQHVEDLGVGFMDRHELVDGIREFWSFADARAKWGAERRTKDEPEWADPDDLLDPVSDAPRPVAELSDPLLTRLQAEEVAGTARTLQRWRQKNLVAPVRTVTIAGVRTAMFRLSDLARVRDEMKTKVGRPRSLEKGATDD